MVTYVSKRGYESQEEDFIEYLFTDYATTIELSDDGNSAIEPLDHRHDVSVTVTPEHEPEDEDS